MFGMHMGRSGASQQAQAMAFAKGHDERARKANIASEAFKNEVANLIFKNFNLFQAVIQQSIEVYLNKIQNKFFRDAGKKRAGALLQKIKGAEYPSDMLNALKAVLNEGNENNDSLKTFLFKAIDRHFCANRAKKLGFLADYRVAIFLEQLFSATEQLFLAFEKRPLTPEEKQTCTGKVLAITGLPMEISKIVPTFL